MVNSLLPCSLYTVIFYRFIIEFCWEIHKSSLVSLLYSYFLYSSFGVHLCNKQVANTCNMATIVYDFLLAVVSVERFTHARKNRLKHVMYIPCSMKSTAFNH